MKKILILDDDESLLETLEINITDFEVVTETDIEKAIEIIKKGGISFIVADIKLKKRRIGYHIFDRLFFKGISVPGIVISSYELSNDEEQYFKKIGIEKITKGGENALLSTRITVAVQEILNDRKKRLEMILKKIEEYDLGRQNITCKNETKSIDTYFQEIFNGKYSVEEEEEIKNAMINVSNTLINRNSDDDYGFPHI